MSIIYEKTASDSSLSYKAFSEGNTNNSFGIVVTDNKNQKETILRDFTAKKEKALDFIEKLFRNTVSPDFVYDIAEDYILS